MIDFNKVKECALYCRSCVTKPCQVGCPLHNDITGFIKFVKEDNFEEAYKLLSKTTYLPAICSRICPHNRQCQGGCVMDVSYDPVEIGYLESVVADLALKNNWNYYKKGKSIGKKVAVVGAGPASLSCAARLRELGVDVTIYEKHNYLGGLLRHGIPDFRLDRDILDKTIKKILDLDININYNKELGKDITLDKLTKEYDAVFLGIGANKSLFLDIYTNDLENVMGANELLESNQYPDFKDKTVCVFGGGNVAMDTSRIIKRLGAKDVIVIYRRSKDEMPAEDKEYQDAIKDGVKFLFLNNIVSIKGNKRLEKIECIKTKLEEVEGSSRLVPKEIIGSNYFIDCDYLIMAIGSKPDSVVSSLNLDLLKNGKIDVDVKQQTSNPKVFAGGDLTSNVGTVAYASHSGIVAALEIYKYLNGDAVE